MVRKVYGKPLKIVPTKEKVIELSLAERIRPPRETRVRTQDEIEEERRMKKLQDVLGSKTYWLESAHQATLERQQKEQKAFDSLKKKPSLHRTVSPLDRELFEIPLIDRREVFFTLLEKEREKRTLIRDEILEHDVK